MLAFLLTFEKEWVIVDVRDENGLKGNSLIS